jgi:holo-[acyl-carrier protein] synthase
VIYLVIDMLCHGVDVIEILRIGKALDRWGAKFLHRIYTEGELRFCRNRLPELAVRFAAKEAVMKSLGLGRRIPWRDIEVLPNWYGAPLLYLYGKAEARAQALGVRKLVVSLSHSREYAIASVVGER